MLRQVNQNQYFLGVFCSRYLAQIWESMSEAIVVQKRWNGEKFIKRSIEEISEKSTSENKFCYFMG